MGFKMAPMVTDASKNPQYQKEKLLSSLRPEPVMWDRKEMLLHPKGPKCQKSTCLTPTVHGIELRFVCVTFLGDQLCYFKSEYECLSVPLTESGAAGQPSVDVPAGIQP